MTREVFLAQLVEWGYDPSRMLSGQWNDNGFHVLNLVGDVAAVVNGVDYVASYFEPWKSPEHYEFVVSFYASGGHDG